MAQGRLSDKSRRFSFLALQELEKVGTRYPRVPVPEKMKEEEIAWLNERLRSFYESVKQTRYKRFSFLPVCKRVRDSLAHSTPDKSLDSISQDWKDFYGIMSQAQAELEQNIGKIYSQSKVIRNFEKNAAPQWGKELERKALIQSLQDAFDSSLPPEEKISFSKAPVAQEVQKFLSCHTQDEKELQTFAMEHKALSQQIQEEIISCVEQVLRDTDIHNLSNPFFEENTAIQKLEGKDSLQLLENMDKFREHLAATQTGNDNSCDFDFYQREFQSVCQSVPDDEQQEHYLEKNHGPYLDTLARNLLQEVTASLYDRLIKWQLDEIDKQRKAYLEQLYQKIRQFKKLEELLSPFTQDFGRLWDMSTGKFDNRGFELLKEFADLLERDQSLQELADLLGRQATEVARYERELRDKVEIRTEFHPKPAFRGQISGLRLSGEIASALPSELALYHNSATRKYFEKKFLEKQLLSYSYTKMKGYSREEHTTEEVQVAIEEGKGPVIICVDTSGSMHGTPEQVVKTITFALTKKCLAEDRHCYLISFSTGIEVQDMSLLKTGESLAELVKFLRKSFNGGTDAEPALYHAVQLMTECQWKRADLLLVSDFVMRELSTELVISINKCKEEKTKFFSLVIGDSGNQNTIACFDENWSYDQSSKGAMAHLVRQLDKI